MAIKTILTFPNGILKQVARNVIADGDVVKQLCEDLVDTARGYKAEGLAAPQIGEGLRVFVIQDHKASTDERLEYKVCINPKIDTPSETSIQSNEGCLSFPGVHETVKRLEAVEVTYSLPTGESVTEILSGVEAVAFQHELDHLNGVVFTDHMGNLQKRMALKALAKHKKRHERAMEQIARMIGEKRL